jgi:hypothetical protein
MIAKARDRPAGLFGWLPSRRRADRSVDETTRRLVKSIGADEPPLDPDPIEELVRLVGESDPRPGGDARARQTSSRRSVHPAIGAVWLSRFLHGACLASSGPGPGDGEATTAPPIVADHERAAHFDGLRMREASIGRAVGISFSFEIANGRARPAGVTYSPRDRNEGH